ncbi:hypothetical protein TIFTF001_033244 [Ficus carica]|uniref:Uncharacterized protein n=1 Tax=Ficus carica TaxID=3494 RepID=A0AA88E4X6_FICCA|nr:hypothetical protein TIFTF001_033244 [Ficus carica]
MGIAIELATRVVGELSIVAELGDCNPRRSENRVEKPLSPTLAEN